MAKLDATSSPEAPRILRWVFGYLAGCSAASIALALHVAISHLPFGEYGEAIGNIVLGPIIVFPMIMLFSLPSYVICRGILHLLRRSDWVSFSIAGAVNAYGLVSVTLGADTLDLYLKYPPNPFVAFAGAAGGAATWWVERWFSNRYAIKAKVI